MRASRVREATPDDLDAIAALTRAHRHRLAGWAPEWWRVADGADELHPLWLGHLVTAEGPVVRVAVDADDAVEACAVAVPQGDAWFVDDVAAATPAAGAAVLDATTERPARTCVATRDAEGADRASTAGMALVASYWIGPARPDVSTPPVPAPPVSAEGAAAPAAVPAHTFGPALADGRAGRLLVDLDGAGRAWGSDPLPPPPIYGAGGTVAVVTAVEGADRAAALVAARGVAAARGDHLVCLVVATADTDLATVAGASGLVRTVDVWSWPA